MRTLDMRSLGLLLLTVLLSGCTQLFFQPHSYLIDTLERHGIKYQIENFQAVDGTPLNAWFLPAQDKNGGKAKATVLFLHGNAENISTHFRNVAWLPAEGFNVLALDYRGYGASEGNAVAGGNTARYRCGHAQSVLRIKTLILIGLSSSGRVSVARSPFITRRTAHITPTSAQSSSTAHSLITAGSPRKNLPVFSLPGRSNGCPG